MTQTPKLGSNGADPVIQSPQKRYIVGSLISDPILKHWGTLFSQAMQKRGSSA